MSSLYEISDRYTALLDFATDLEDEQAFEDTLEAIKGELVAKADDYGAVMSQMGTQADALDAEIKRLTARKKVIENNITRMKSAMLSALEQTGNKKIQTAKYTFSIAKNGGIQPMKITGDVPDKFKRVVYETDNAKIREALEKGEKLDFAHLEERGTHLKIS